MRRLAALIAAAAFLLLAAPALADVLVNAPEPVVACGGKIKLGVWYRDFPTTGHRDASAEVLSARGFVLFRRSVQAPSQWKYWSYKPRCGRRYTVRYTTFAGVTRFRVRVNNMR